MEAKPVLERPPYTMIHNHVLDHIMPDLSPNAWKVLCFAIRQTYGWADSGSPTGRKQADVISYSQFMKGTGIGGRSTLFAAITECMDKGYLMREPAGSSRGRTIYSYRLNTDYSVLIQDSTTTSRVLKQDSTPSPRVLKQDSVESQNRTLKSPETGLTKERNKQTNVAAVVLTTLMANGLTSVQAEQWAEALPQELIEANVAYLDTPQASGINSRAAYLISQFKKGAYPPQAPKPKEDNPRRFIEGKYAHLIEH